MTFIFLFQCLFPTFGDFAFCPTILLQHSHQSTMVYRDFVWQRIVAGSHWLLFVHYFSWLSFTTYSEGSNQNFFVSIHTVGYNFCR